MYGIKGDWVILFRDLKKYFHKISHKMHLLFIKELFSKKKNMNKKLS